MLSLSPSHVVGAVAVWGTGPAKWQDHETLTWPPERRLGRMKRNSRCCDVQRRADRMQADVFRNVGRGLTSKASSRRGKNASGPRVFKPGCRCRCVSMLSAKRRKVQGRCYVSRDFPSKCRWGREAKSGHPVLFSQASGSRGDGHCGL